MFVIYGRLVAGESFVYKKEFATEEEARQYGRQEERGRGWRYVVEWNVRRVPEEKEG